MHLDFFLLTSSLAAMGGNKGQIVYAAANAFLDGLAWWLRERGVLATSVNFGLWSTGMGDKDSRELLEMVGLRTISPAEALAGMAEFVAASAPQGWWPGSTGNASCHSKGCGGNGRSCRRSSVKCPRLQRCRCPPGPHR